MARCALVLAALAAMCALGAASVPSISTVDGSIVLDCILACVIRCELFLTPIPPQHLSMSR